MMSNNRRNYEKILICPSVMCADFDNLKSEIIKLDNAGSDIFHIDIMDGSFVPNFGMGIQDIKTIRKNTKKKIDAHLMIKNPIKHIDLFKSLGIDIIYIHSEADILPATTLMKIKDVGVIPGLAINPGTGIESIKPLLNLVKYVLIMTVNPGFSGQKYLNFVDDKIKRIISYKDKYNLNIFVDGAISPDKVKYLSSIGVDGFILGTATLFGKTDSYKDIINSLKKY